MGKKKISCYVYPSLFEFEEDNYTLRNLNLTEINLKLLEAYKDYHTTLLNIRYNSRGDDKQNGLHDLIKSIIRPFISNRYLIYSKSNLILPNCINEEYKIPDYVYGERSMDITIYDTKYQRVVLCINCKGPLSSYKKNERHYASDMGSECESLKKVNDIGIFYFYIMLSQIPVMEGKKISRFDNIGYEQIKAFDRQCDLLKEHNKPTNGCCICVFDDSVIPYDKVGKSEITTFDRFKELHNDGYDLAYKEIKEDFDNVIYNNFESFINRILDYIDEYEKIQD